MDETDMIYDSVANIRTQVEKSEYAVTSNELKNQFDIPIQLFLSCIGYQ